MEDKKIWFDRVLRDTKKTVLQACKYELRKHPLLCDDLEDLIQETYLELYNKYERLQSHGNITGWLVETVKRKTKDRAKRLYREIKRTAIRIDSGEVFLSTFADNSDVPDDVYLRKEKSEELRNAIARDMGEDTYRLLEAHYVYKVPIGELAKENGISSDALKMRFSRLKKRLREKGKEFFEQPK